MKILSFFIWWKNNYELGFICTNKANRWNYWWPNKHPRCISISFEKRRTIKDPFPIYLCFNKIWCWHWCDHLGCLGVGPPGIGLCRCGDNDDAAAEHQRQQRSRGLWRQWWRSGRLMAALQSQCPRKMKIGLAGLESVENGLPWCAKREEEININRRQWPCSFRDWESRERGGKVVNNDRDKGVIV